MFKSAVLIGLYSYLIFFLGILGLLYSHLILFFTIVFVTLLIAYLFKTKKITKIKLDNFNLDLVSRGVIGLLILQIVINLIGVLGPETSFDSLWYHLTLPKLYLENHSIFHIPGGLLYYSDMPKNMEMLYIPALSIGNEITVKFIHFLFGLLTLYAIFKLSKLFLSTKYSLIACLVFYSNLVVGWESITSYVDLGWAFFEVCALYYFLLWFKKKNFKYLVFTGILVGLSISVKVVAINSIFIFGFLILYLSLFNKESIGTELKNLLCFLLPAIIVPLPWFIFSFVNTGNPFYPLFESSIPLINNINILNSLKMFINSPDPISPLYIIFLPLIIFLYKKQSNYFKLLVIYSGFVLILWIIFSSIGGTRFLIPYLAVFSILIAYVISIYKKKYSKLFLLFLVILVSVSSIGYRALANYKYIPVVLGLESKDVFLSKNLNFSYADFYDTDGYFKNNIKETDKVLLIGFHNLYYVDFPYIHSSWVKKGDKFNYIAIQNSSLPEMFSNWREIYYNKQTGVRLYAPKK